MRRELISIFFVERGCLLLVGGAEVEGEVEAASHSAVRPVAAVRRLPIASASSVRAERAQSSSQASSFREGASTPAASFYFYIHILTQDGGRHRTLPPPSPMSRTSSRTEVAIAGRSACCRTSFNRHFPRWRGRTLIGREPTLRAPSSILHRVPASSHATLPQADPGPTERVRHHHADRECRWAPRSGRCCFPWLGRWRGWVTQKGGISIWYSDAGPADVGKLARENGSRAVCHHRCARSVAKSRRSSLIMASTGPEKCA